MWKKIRHWLEVRVGLDNFIQTQVIEYRIPKNINLFYTLGFITVIAYGVQAFTGIVLLIYYIPHPDHAFRSVQDIMTKVPYGWLFRQMHTVGSNLMITVVLLHMITVFLMGNYKRPRELTWLGGGLSLLMTIMFGLSGYLLPWTQLSYWATTVVTSMPTALPVIGEPIARILRGGDTRHGYHPEQVLRVPCGGPAAPVPCPDGSTPVPDQQDRHLCNALRACRRGKAAADPVQKKNASRRVFLLSGVLPEADVHAHGLFRRHVRHHHLFPEPVLP